jgi:opacity protein-like surface antigen
MKRIKSRATRLVLCTAFLMMFGEFVLAQNVPKHEYPKVEIFVGYSALGEINSRGISFGANRSVGANYSAEPGVEISVIRNFSRHFGVKGDFSAHLKNETGRGPISSCVNAACTTVTQDFQLKTRVYNFLAGPELKARNGTRFTPFAHVLGGVAQTRARFTTPGPTLNILLKKSDTSFAMALGGGLDIRATQRVSFRAQMDYNPVFVHDSTSGTRDLVRISLGVLFH